MYIKHVKINNFRGIKEGYFEFHDGMNILIGPSNIGKTTVLTAMDFTLNPKYSWWRRDILSELDFYKKNTDEPFVIEMMLGCGRYKCAEKGNNCPRFDIGTEETCKLAHRTINVDRNSQKVLKESDEEILDNTQVESCILLRMEAKYQPSDGYVEVSHTILNEDHEVWGDFTRPMQEWIGEILFVSGDNPSSECKLQYNSLLARAIGEINEWEQGFVKEFKSKLEDSVKLLSNGQAKDVLEKFKNQSAKLQPILAGNPILGIKGAEKRDLLRQVELCFQTAECELPLVRYGKGMQNMASMIMAALAQATTRKTRPPVSIVMIEEPEQNLEPQLQRSILKFISDLLGENSNRQFIITTHSPYIVSADLKLDKVIKLNVNESNKVEGLFFYTIKDTIKIRKRVQNDSELFESLFSNLVIVWEGESEAGLYNAIMRNRKDFPEEMLTGIDGQGSNVLSICEWFKAAKYDVIAVIDSDIGDPKQLYRSEIPFISLSNGNKIEEALADILMNIDGKDAAEILVRVIGASGMINKTAFEGHNGWADLKAVFTSEGAVNEVQTEKVWESFKYKSLPERKIIIDYLCGCKKRYYHDVLGEMLVKHWDKLGIIKLVIEKLKSIWFNRKELGQYQFTNKGELELYRCD